MIQKPFLDSRRPLVVLDDSARPAITSDLSGVRRRSAAGVHCVSDNWNPVWKQYMSETPEATAEDIVKVLQKVRKRFGI